MKSLLLDLDNHDLVVDSAGNIALAADPYALAQNAGCAIRLFQGELWYNTTPGVPYRLILGKSPNIPYMKARFVDAALTVPGVKAAVCFISSIANRKVSGQVQVTDINGDVTAAAF